MKSCLVLTLSSRDRLVRVARELSLHHGAILENPTIHCHHLTLSFNGDLPEGYQVGQKYKLILTEYGISNKAIAFFVDGPVKGCESGNPHITFATSQGAKPIDSLNISEFYHMSAIEVEGVFRFGENCFSSPLEK
jgi:hypothetical protein